MKPELVFPRTPEDFDQDIVSIIASRWKKEERCAFCKEPCTSSHWHLRTRIKGKSVMKRQYFHRECCPFCSD